MSVQNIARRFASSQLFDRARGLLKQNQLNWNLPLSKWEKLQIGMYLIISDFSEGNFPPKFADQGATHQGEVAYRDTIAADPKQTSDAEFGKPFWFGPVGRAYLGSLVATMEDFERLGIHPPQRLLELGAGTGWLAEAFARMGFDVVGTSIAPDDIADAERRIVGLRAMDVPSKVEFRIGAMESIHEVVRDRIPFDVVLIHQALHHAHDWRAAFESAFACLRPGGWLVVGAEPNLVHTFVSYRVARLSNTHEIGLSRSKMRAHLRRVGFSKIVILRNRFHWFTRTHWFAAQR